MITPDPYVPKASRNIKPISSHLARPSKKISAKFGFHDPGFLAHWPTYVGEEIANIAHPRKLKPRRNNGATLVLDCISAHASELRMRADEIQMRINGALGFQAIGKIEIQHQAIGFAEPKAAFVPKPAAKPAENQAPQELTKTILKTESESLREALTTLTQSYYQNRR